MLIRVCVDVQHSFCHLQGALYTTGAETIVPLIARLNHEAEKQDIFLIGSLDTHDYASREFVENGGPWPPHCIKGSEGWLMPAEILPKRFRILSQEPTDVIQACDDQRAALFFEKDSYNVFDNPNLDRLLTFLKQKDHSLEFEVYGIALDYCVHATVLELRKRGHAVTLIKNATIGINVETTAAALKEMKTVGVMIDKRK